MSLDNSLHAAGLRCAEHEHVASVQSVLLPDADGDGQCGVCADVSDRVSDFLDYGYWKGCVGIETER